MLSVALYRVVRKASGGGRLSKDPKEVREQAFQSGYLREGMPAEGTAGINGLGVLEHTGKGKR